MSLSKLDPSPTSGSSSQVSFDDQDPISEKQHPLLLPTVMDAIFPYLNFSEVKISRLVCKAWAELGIPFIGRRNLEPVKFSTIPCEDFLALKKEFLKFPQKVKLFQGFELKWDEMNVMIWNNFLASFKPSQLAISGGNVRDPSTNFNNLLQPLLTTLTHLSLEIILDSYYSSSSFTALLNNFAQLQPMTLKILRLKISVEKEEHQFTCEQVNSMFQAFEVVFQSQSTTLEELELKFKCYVFEPGNPNHRLIIKEIEFPVFSSLQHLTLVFDIVETFRNYLSIFAPFDFCVKFPQLVRLDIDDMILFKMARGITFDLTRRHPLKKLNIISFRHALSIRFDILMMSFPILEEFSGQGKIPLWEEIPWGNTMRNLKIHGFTREFNFLHMGNLEYLHLTIHHFDDEVNGDVNELINRLLNHYTQLPHLKKFHLSDLKVSSEQMIQIQEGLPAEFQAILTID